MDGELGHVPTGHHPRVPCGRAPRGLLVTALTGGENVSGSRLERITEERPLPGDHLGRGPAADIAVAVTTDVAVAADGCTTGRSALFPWLLCNCTHRVHRPLIRLVGRRSMPPGHPDAPDPR
jgi:hypothetical protein